MKAGSKLGPYRIEKQIGAGGMGEVYQAFDERLGRWVAVKRIRPDVRTSDEQRERFRREARTVASLSHPAIVQIYDIIRDGDADTIVLEYVEGETLASILERAPLAPQQVAAIGREIAAGLAAAHSQGVVHRDLKADNVIVTLSGQVKILDFGIAKHPALEPDTGLTNPGTVMGTSRAMSPEHASGERVDARSDLFSLGTLLYEAATGKHPFVGDTELATLMRVISHRPPGPDALNPAVPPRLSQLILDLLHKRPDRRPADAREVANACTAMLAGPSGVTLDPQALLAGAGRIGGGELPPTQPMPTPNAGTVTQLSPTAPTLRQRAGRRRWPVRLVSGRYRRAAVITLALLVALILGAAFAWRGRWSATETFAIDAREWIVLGSFENLTGNPELDGPLDQAFRIGLEQSRYANVLPAGQVRKALERMERDADTPIDRALGVEICQRESAKALVIGSVVSVGDSYSLAAEIVDPATDRSFFARAEQAADLGAVLPALERLTRSVRANLGESLAAIEKSSQPLEKVTTKDLAALRAYSQGSQLVAAGKVKEAVTLLEEAVKLDPEFAMAHARLGMAYRNYDRSGERTLEHWLLALEFSDRLTDSEKLYVDGQLSWQGTPKAMVDTWSRMTTLYPENVFGHHGLGIAYWLYLNDFRSAERVFERAKNCRDPFAMVSLHHLGYCQLGLGSFGDALASFRTSWESYGNPVAWGMVDAYLVLDRDAEAEAFLADNSVGADDYQRLEASLKLALVRVDQGRMQEAAAIAEEVAAEGGEDERERAVLAARSANVAAAIAGGDEGALGEALDRAYQTARDLVPGGTWRPGYFVGPYLAGLAKAHVRAGELDRAAELTERAALFAEEKDSPLWRAYAQVAAAELETAHGRPGAATELLRSAVAAADLFQAHDSLAHAYAAAGDGDRALAEYEWVVRHRGRVFAECVDHCLINELNDVTWVAAHYHLGRLREQAGDLDAARRAYQELVEQWGSGDPDLPLVAAARRRLDLLDPPAVGRSSARPAQSGRLPPPTSGVNGSGVGGSGSTASGANGSGSKASRPPSASGTPQPQIATGPSAMPSIPSSRSMLTLLTAAVKKAPRPRSVATR